MNLVHRSEDRWGTELYTLRSKEQLKQVTQMLSEVLTERPPLPEIEKLYKSNDYRAILDHCLPQVYKGRLKDIFDQTWKEVSGRDEDNSEVKKPEKTKLLEMLIERGFLPLTIPQIAECHEFSEFGPDKTTRKDKLLNLLSYNSVYELFPGKKLEDKYMRSLTAPSYTPPSQSEEIEKDYP